MPTLSTDQGLNLPADPDLNDVATAFAAYNAGVESRLVKRYLNATDRFVRNPSPVQGQLTYLAAENRYDYYTGSAWAAVFDPGAWMVFVPTWGAVSGTQPTLGNGSISGRFQQVGKTVHFYITLLMGSTSTYPTTQWYLTLPVPCVTTPPSLVQIFHGRVFDVSAGSGFLAVGQAQSGTYIALETQSSVTPAAGTDAVRQGFPVTWASGDAIYFSGTYEAA